MTELEILKAVRELLIGPARWTQGLYARNTDGEACEPGDSDAACFCLVGAYQRVTDQRIRTHAAMNNLLAGCMPAGLKSASLFNDEYTHADVIAALDCAIAKRETANAQ